MINVSHESASAAASSRLPPFPLYNLPPLSLSPSLLPLDSNNLSAQVVVDESKVKLQIENPSCSMNFHIHHHHDTILLYYIILYSPISCYQLATR